MLRTPNYIIGGMPEANYKKNNYQISENSTLYIFSDGVYEFEKPDGSMWKFEEFAEFMCKAKKDGDSRLDRLYRYAKKIGESSNFEDDFTIVELAFK